MGEHYLSRLFEHNHWANIQIIEACMALSAEQLDAQPHAATKGTIRETLVHLVSAQRGYLSTLTLPVEQRPRGPVPFDELLASERASSQGLSALVETLAATEQTRDGYQVEAWVIILQVINHATEHREQIKSMLTALGITPPEIDGWDYGLATGALVPIAK
jgi:uncharacterized damage-inducible protein DinB